MLAKLIQKYGFPLIIVSAIALIGFLAFPLLPFSSQQTVSSAKVAIVDGAQQTILSLETSQPSLGGIKKVNVVGTVPNGDPQYWSVLQSGPLSLPYSVRTIVFQVEYIPLGHTFNVFIVVDKTRAIVGKPTSIACGSAHQPACLPVTQQ